MSRALVLFIVSTIATGVSGQSTNASLNEEYYHKIDRYEIKSGVITKELFTSVKPYKRSAIVAMLDSLQLKENVFQSPSDQFNLEYLRNDNWEWSQSQTNESKTPILKTLFRKKSDLYHVEEPDFDLHINPVLYVGMGKDSRSNSSLFINTRGVEIRGMIDKKIGFYTYLSDNQARLPMYATEFSSLYGYYTVPHQGFWKDFKNGGVDFFEARAYIDFNISKHIYMQFGHDRTNIGNGFRSLIMSDFAPPSQFLRANLKIWKLNYLFQMNRMTASFPSSPTGASAGTHYPEKYVAFHHLSMNLGKKFNIGVFESVVFSPQDSINGGTFELNYLNPVIFYRSIEQQNGSSDNAIVGLDWKWIVAKRLSLYGQFVLDEFVLNNITSGNGWWANKFAIQGGLKYIDVAGINNLDLQMEANVVRPFTYSHANFYTSYTNYLQPMAHPLGANFYELAAIIRYQPIPRLNVTVKSFYVKTGRDETVDGMAVDLPYVNWGGDINKSYTTRQQEFNNKIAQGYDNTIMFTDVMASYMFRHNFFIDLKGTFRSSKSPKAAFDNNSTVTSIALRWNIASRLYDF
ncbi:MAG: hypothetical protein HOP08_20350 [Cyclobacteriaceae bacterium]|nr:hypothetical protein [Cyclobacteriaceae bacterium]